MHLFILLIFFIYNFECNVIKFPEPTSAATGLRQAGKATQTKQRNALQKLKRMTNTKAAQNNNNNNNEECDQCLKKGSGNIYITVSKDTNTDKKQYSRGIENRITYNIFSKDDISQSFYDRPFIDSTSKIMKSLIFQIEIEESPLSQQQITTLSTKDALIQRTKRELFKLIINSEQPLSELSKIQKEYKKSGGELISAYTHSLNGIETLKYSDGVDVVKFIEKYELSKPYYSRKAVGDLPIKICNQYSFSLKCTNRYLINFGNDEDEELNKNIRVSVFYPLIPGELVIAPLFLIKTDSPNLKQHSMGYKKWWECDNDQFGMEQCIYKLKDSLSTKKWFVNEPIQGTVRIGKGEIDGNWQKCGNKAYKDKNRKKCAIKLKNIWPGSVTKIKIELMHPPRFDGEYASIEFQQIPPKVFYFTTSTKEAQKNKINEYYSMNKIKNICFGDIKKCKNKYLGGTTANIAGSSTNLFLSRSWSKPITLKIQNRFDKLPLQNKMFYKMKATFKSSTIWRKYLGFSYQPPFIQNQLIFDLKASQIEMLKIECEFEPKQVIVGQTVEIYISVKNKQNGFLRSGLRSLYRSESKLQSVYQNIDVMLIPIGNGNGDQDKIGLEPIKNIVQIRKRDNSLNNIRKQETTPGKFKVLSNGKQCISFEIKGIGKTYYKEKTPECIDVIGELKAEYVDGNDEKINTIFNDEESDKFKLIIKTGSEASLQGKVIITPKINGIKSYQFNMNPDILTTKTCKRDCILPFDITPKLICAFNENSNEFKVNAEITWTVSYLVNGRNVYFPTPSSIKLVIIEKQFNDDQQLLEFKEKFPEKYKRWQKCQDSIKDINPLLPCNQISNETVNTNMSMNCIPNDEIDSDDEILKEIEENEIINSKNLKWYKNFWQNNWNWQYLILGSSTIFILFAILIELGCIDNNQSFILEMLQNMTSSIQS